MEKQIIIQEKVRQHIAKNGGRNTHERNVLIDIVSKMEVFRMETLIVEAKKQRVSRGTVYLFVEMLEKIGVLVKQESHRFNNQKPI